MEYLALLVIYGVVRLVKGGTENTSAILKGSEPPEITKFNARRKNGSIAGKLAEAVSRPVGRPKAGKPAKEPGPARKVFRAWKANTAAAAVDKMQHRHERKVTWYREHGKSIEDEKWHARQQAKLRAKQKKLEQLKTKKGLAEPQQVEGQVVNDKQNGNDQQGQPVPENVANLDEARAKRGDDGEQQKNSTPVKRETPEDVAKQHPLYCAAAPMRKHVSSEEKPGVCSWCGEQYRSIQPQHTKNNAKTGSEDKTNTEDKSGGTTTQTKQKTAAGASGSTTSTTGGSSMYEQAAADLHRHAADVDSYNDDLKTFADDLAARGWGNEVSSPASDMAGHLQEAAGIMRDVATSMGDQGGNVARAYEAAPFAPDKRELVRN